MKIVTFWRMPRQQKHMFVVDWCLGGLAWIAIKSLPYHKLSRFFGHHHRMLAASTILSPKQIQQAVHIKRMIALTERYSPWHLNCLMQAVLAKFWCQRYQIPYMLFIGFAKSSQQPLGKEGHAWVTAGPLAITGGHSLATHQIVLTYSNCHLKTTAL